MVPAISDLEFSLESVLCALKLLRLPTSWAVFMIFVYFILASNCKELVEGETCKHGE